MGSYHNALIHFLDFSFCDDKIFKFFLNKNVILGDLKLFQLCFKLPQTDFSIYYT